MEADAAVVGEVFPLAQDIVVVVAPDEDEDEEEECPDGITVDVRFGGTNQVRRGTHEIILEEML